MTFYSDENDIEIVLYNLRNEFQSMKGFSIKSKLGGSSTLLNASVDNTNFLYEINDLEQSAISTINGIEKVRQRFATLKQTNGSISFVRVVSNIMQNNLVYIQDRLPELLGLVLEKYYSSSLSKISDIVEDIARSNPLGYDYSQNQDFYQYKIKNFLVAVALGLKPGKAWKGNYDVNGGYLIVKEDGDVICYHLYDRNQFEDYLYFNTKLETPSTTRHNFGKIYLDNGRHYIKLNLQIRFL